MAAAPIDPFAELASSVSNLEALAGRLKIQLQALSMQVLQRPQPLAPLVPATSAKMPKHVITDVIVTQHPCSWHLAVNITYGNFASIASHFFRSGLPTFNPIAMAPLNGTIGLIILTIKS